MESFPWFCELLIEADPLWQEKQTLGFRLFTDGDNYCQKSSTEFCEAADGSITATVENN